MPTPAIASIRRESPRRAPTASSACQVGSSCAGEPNSTTARRCASVGGTPLSRYASTASNSPCRASVSRSDLSRAGPCNREPNSRRCSSTNTSSQRGMAPPCHGPQGPDVGENPGPPRRPVRVREPGIRVRPPPAAATGPGTSRRWRPVRRADRAGSPGRRRGRRSRRSPSSPLSRWVTSSTEWPAGWRRAADASTASAAAGSSPSVGSSSTSTGGAASSARASASRCRWPPESCPPSSPTSVSQPAGWARTQLQQAGRRQWRRQLVLAGPGPPEQQVLPHRGVEDVRVGEQPAHRAGQRVLGVRRRS